MEAKSRLYSEESVYLPGKISDRKPIHALYMDPPLARVGYSEEEAKNSGKELLFGRYKMSDVSRAREKGETDGIELSKTPGNGTAASYGIRVGAVGIQWP